MVTDREKNRFTARAARYARVGTRVGVVIQTYNGAHVLRPCLDALLAEPPARCTATLIVVDDASTDRTPELLEGYGDAVVAVVQSENRGFAHACNAGAAAAAGADHVVFLNNDTIPIGGWLDALVDAAAEHPEAGAIGARLLYQDGTIQRRSSSRGS